MDWAGPWCEQSCNAGPVAAGYGDVAPTTRTERIIAMVIMAVGERLPSSTCLLAVPGCLHTVGIWIVCSGSHAALGMLPCALQGI